MLTKEILDSHPLKTLKSEISKQNIKGYSKMKRSELTALMMKHKDKFMHIKHAEKKEKKAKAKAPAKPKGTHKMPDGSEMTGKVHSKDSKPVKKKEPTKLIPKKKPKEEPKKKASNTNIKNDVLQVLNKHYGGIIKYEKKVLSGKLIDESDEYEDEYKSNETDFDQNLMKLFKKYKLKSSEESEFFSSNNGYPLKLSQLIKYDNIPHKSLSNYKKLTEINKKLEEKAAAKKAPKRLKKEAEKTKPKPKGRKKTVKMLTLAKGQGTSTKIGNVIGPDGNSYEPYQAAKLWEERGFKRVELSKADLKKTEKLAIKYGPFGKYGLGNQLESFLKNKF